MKKIRFPESLVLIFAMIIAAQVAVYLLPAGSYERVEAPGSHREMVVPGTYHELTEAELPEDHFSRSPAAFVRSLPTFLLAIPKGLETGADIIFFVFIVGGVIGVIRATGAFDALIGLSLKHLGSRPVVLVAGMTTLFAIGSSTIGMAEEYMPFIPILVTMCLALKMDAMVAMGIVYIGAGVGYGAAALNPFTVLVGQKIAEVPLTSGQAFRWCLLAACLVVGVHHVMRYARRVQADRDASLVGDVDYSDGFDMPEDLALTGRRLAILLTLLAGVCLFVYGLRPVDQGGWGWYFGELNAVFLALAVISAVIAGITPNDAARRFCSGAAEMTTTALLIGFARTIEIVLSEGQVIDTVIHSIAGPLEQLGPSLAATGMFAVQCLCNFFIPSGSGQAYVTMPIMSPLSDLVGISRQTAVLAYQMGDGFTNMVVPTNALLMGMLGLGRIPYQRWLRFILPLVLKLFLVGSLALILAVQIGYA